MLYYAFRNIIHKCKKKGNKKRRQNIEAGIRISGYQEVDIRASGYQYTGRSVLDNFFVFFVPFCGENLCSSVLTCAAVSVSFVIYDCRLSIYDCS
jgi:hypothetical protein